MKEHEHCTDINKLREGDDTYAKYGVPVLPVFQFHMIGQIDDWCSWQCGNLKPHDTHADECAKARLAWSKNVAEERDAPWQHVFGSMDPEFCVLLNVVLWLKVFLGSVFDSGQQPLVFAFSDDVNPKDASKRMKDMVCKTHKAAQESIGVDVADMAMFASAHPLGHNRMECTKMTKTTVVNGRKNAH